MHIPRSPFNIVTLGQKQVTTANTDTLSVVYVIQGTCRVNYRERIYPLPENGFLFIDSCEPFAYICEGMACQIIFVAEALSQRLLPAVFSSYHCCSELVEVEEQQRISFIIKQVLDSAPGTASSYEEDICAAMLLQELSGYHLNKNSEGTSSWEALFRESLLYIHSHYDQKLTAVMLAKKMHCSQPYISRLFKKCLHTSFSAYLTEVRLKAAGIYLQESGISVSAAAEKTGFSSAAALTKSFKERYGEAPSQFRQRSGLCVNSESGREEFLSLYMKTAFGSLQQTLPVQTEVPVQIVFSASKGVEEAPVEIMLPLCDPRFFIYPDRQKYVKQFLKQCPCRQVMLRGIFGSDYHIFRSITDHEVFYDYRVLDEAISFALSQNLKPVIDLGCMPEDLAEKTRHQEVMDYDFGSPKSMEAWFLLVRNTVQHLIRTYGGSAVSEWKFFTWLFPLTPYLDVFGIEERGFFEFYKTTWQAAQSCGLKLTFGTPLMDQYYNSDKKVMRQWLRDFASYCRENACEPSFYHMSWFPESIEKSRFQLKKESSKHAPALNPEEELKELRKLLDEIGLINLPVYITEWGITHSNSNTFNDRIINAALIAKSYLGLHGFVKAVSYSPFSDHILGTVRRGQVFCGESGLLTFNGIPKASFRVFHLLGLLKGRIMIKNDWMMICHEQISGIITGVLCHCLMPKSFGNMILVYDEKNGFVPESSRAMPEEAVIYQKRVELLMKNIAEKNYILTEYILNEQNGDTYARWKENDSGYDIRPEDIDYLSSTVNYRILHRNVSSKDSTLRYECTLKPYEVRGLQFVPTDQP